MRRFFSLVLLSFVSSLFLACSPAEDRVVHTYTIVNCKYANVMKDTLPGSKVISKVKVGTELYLPSTESKNWTSTFMSGLRTTGYINNKYVKKETTIITHSSRLRSEYNQKIVPDLDEKYDSVAKKYVAAFPMKKVSFWRFAILIAIGIAVFYGIADVDVPLGFQLFGLIAYAPFGLWLAFATHLYGFKDIDGFLARLIILLGMLALVVCMTMAITASIGKFVGHNFTFRYCIATTIGISLTYFGVAFFHYLADFFFKFLIFLYILFFIYFLIKRAFRIKRLYEDGDTEWWGYIVEIISIPLIFGAVTAFLGVIYVPMQVVSSLLLSQLSGLVFIIYMIICGFTGLAYNSSNDDSERDFYVVGPTYDGSGLREGSDGYYYDVFGNKYKKIRAGEYRREY